MGFAQWLLGGWTSIKPSLAQMGCLNKYDGLMLGWFMLQKPPQGGVATSPSASQRTGDEEEEGGWDGGIALPGFGVT